MIKSYAGTDCLDCGEEHVEEQEFVCPNCKSENVQDMKYVTCKNCEEEDRVFYLDDLCHKCQ